MQCECVLLSFLLIIQFENCSLTILDYRIKLVIFKSLWVPFQKTFSTSFLELSSLDILKSKLRDTQDNYLFKRIFCTYNKNCICYHQNSFVKPWSQQSPPFWWWQNNFWLFLKNCNSSPLICAGKQNVKKKIERAPPEKYAIPLQ